MSLGARLNPFQPDTPVRVSLFTGRSAERRLIQQTTIDTLRDRASHVLIVGERGMGKTSLARFAAELATSPETAESAGGVNPPAVLAASLGYSATVPEVCACVLTEAYRWARNRSSPLVRWFRSELKGVEGLTVGLFGVTVGAKLGSANPVPHAFPDALEQLYGQMSPHVGGLVVVLDETEAISADAAFPGFLKSVVEVLDARGLRSIQLVLTATPEGRDRMTAAHPSFPRLFRPVPIDPMSDAEVGELLDRALDEGLPRKRATDSFRAGLAGLASGIPGFVHEIGRAAFDVDDDDVLDDDDLQDGVMGTDRVVGAVAILEQKHFRERYTKKVLSNTYRQILHAIAAAPTDEVSTEHLRRHCAGVAQIAPYLANMAKRGVVVRVEGKKGVYRLPDRMFGVFLRMAEARRKAGRRG
jgi:hypothetical protein